VDLPQTLHSQLYLLAYDRKRHLLRFNRNHHRRLFGFALRAAMLTDLYLTGYLVDKNGKAYPASVARPADPVLQEALKGVNGQNWSNLIARSEHDVRRVVRDQLEAIGWLRAQERRLLGIIPTARLGLYDEDMVSGLADRLRPRVYAVAKSGRYRPRTCPLPRPTSANRLSLRSLGRSGITRGDAQTVSNPPGRR
jgi:hypothetical protein